MTRISLAAILIFLVAIPATAQKFTQPVDEAALLAVTGRADTDTEELTVGPTGNIYVIDEDEFNNDRVLRFDSGGGSGVLITTENAIVAAIAAVNNGAFAPNFSINSISIDTDGDIILTNGDGTGADSLVSVADTASPAAITVVSTAVSPAASPVEGCTGGHVIGTTAFVLFEGGFGAGQDSVGTVDVNGAGPAVAVTTIIDSAELAAAAPAAAGSFRLNAANTGGLGLLFANSGTGGVSDDILTSNLAGTVVSLYVAAASVEAASAATDVGFNSMAEDGNGDLWVTNLFGTGLDDNIYKITNPGPGQSISVFGEIEVVNDILSGETVGGAEGIDFDVTNSRMVFAIGTGNVEGVGAVGQAEIPVELSIFSTD